MADPPYGIGDELVAFGFVKPLSSPDKPYIALINKVGQGHALMAAVEESKINLSSCERTTADLSFIEAGLQSHADRAQFEDSLHGSLESIQTTINDCIMMAGVKADDIALVILTGGGTAIPLIQKITRRIFPQAGISDGNRLSSVGFGLACDARRYYLGLN